jgi:hypothetical protein
VGANFRLRLKKGHLLVPLWSCAHEMDWPMRADPRVGARRAQSTSKDLSYRGQTLMLHGGPAFVTFLDRGSD